MIGNGERVGRLRDATARLTRAAVVAALAAVPLVGASAQSQPPGLEVYSDTFVGGTAAPGGLGGGRPNSVRARPHRDSAPWPESRRTHYSIAGGLGARVRPRGPPGHRTMVR